MTPAEMPLRSDRVWIAFAGRLLLLRDAWDDYDVTCRLALRNKLLAKTLFALQLLVGWLIVLFGTLSGLNDSGDGCVLETAGRSSLGQASFALTVVASVLISLDSIWKAKSRWQQLRSYAGLLESTIWLYRTRTGLFRSPEGEAESRAPETALCASLNEWREELAAGADLDGSTLNRGHARSTYRHAQRRDCPPLHLPNGRGGSATGTAWGMGVGDDHHSPMRHQAYIQQRILPRIEYYQRRLPRLGRRKVALVTLLLGCTVASAILARYGASAAVVIVTGATTSLTSWGEYSDLQRKTERHNRVIRKLRKLLSWWNSLSEVEKASTEAVAHLILSAEAAISDERLSWGAAGSKEIGESNDDQDRVRESSSPSASRPSTQRRAGENANSSQHRGRAVISPAE